jgi:hypothetical protein
MGSRSTLWIFLRKVCLLSYGVFCDEVLDNVPCTGTPWTFIRDLPFRISVRLQDVFTETFGFLQSLKGSILSILVLHSKKPRPPPS